MAATGRTAEAHLASIASRAHGVATREQLLAAGLTRHEITWRLRTGALVAVHRGVYRVGHTAPNVDASYLAAVYACGVGAVLAGSAAAFNAGLVRGNAPAPEVLTPRERRVPGVACRRMRGLDARYTSTFRGIPTLTVPAILVDIARRLAPDDLARACHEAGIRFGTTPRQVEAVLGRRRNAPGAAALRAVMSGEARVSLSRLESRFLERLGEIDRPLPITNKSAGGRRVDCRWPAHHLTVELDSYGFHNSRYSWERDHRREREAYGRGDDFRRFTYGDVFDEPREMLAELSCLLPMVSAKGRTAARLSS